MNSLQDAVLAMEHTVTAMERIFDLTAILMDAKCQSVPEILCAVFCTSNPGKPVCHAVMAATYIAAVSYVALVLAEVAHAAVSSSFEKDTLGPGQAIDQFEYAKATHKNVKISHDWNFKALGAMNSALNSQHVSMRQHLQERHLQMETNIGEDINDSRNALGQAIVDSQNANGQLIVDAQNEVSRQHNSMVKWLDNKFAERMCVMFESQGGTCSNFVGTLEEGEIGIPLELHWSEDQPSLSDRFDGFQRALGNRVSGTEEDDSNDANVIREIQKMKKMVEQNKQETDQIKQETEQIKGMVHQLLEQNRK